MDAPPNDPPRAPEPGAAEPVAPGPQAPAPIAAAPQPRPNGLTFFAVVLALFVLLGTGAQASNAVLGLAWSEIFALLVPTLIAVAGWNLTAHRALMLAPGPSAAVVVLAVLAGCVGFAGAGALMALNSLILPQRWVETFDVTRIFERPVPQRVALAVIASTVAPFCEEVAFRGWLLTALRTRWSAPVAIAATAFLFALMHMDPVRFGALLALGGVYGWLAWRAGSVWPAIAAHAANNTVGVLLAASGAAGNGVLAARPLPGQIAASAALMLVLSGGVLRLIAAGYARATRTPPPVSEMLSRRDPSDMSARFDSRRVHPTLLAITVVGALLLCLLLVAGHATRR